MIARQVMSAPVFTVRPETPVAEVAALLSQHRISGLVVVDDEGRAVGVVGGGDLLYRVARPHLPPHVELLGTVIYLETPSRIDSMMRRIAGATAGDLMSPRVYSAVEDTPIEDVASLMLDRKIHRVPVLREGRPVGIITRGDVIRHAIAGAVRRQVEAEETAEDQSQSISGVSSSEI